MASSLNSTMPAPIRTPWECKYCGSDRAHHTPPRPDKNQRITNAGALHCADCGKFGRWLSVGQAVALGLNGNGGQA
jgi:hypothetical protein